MHSLRLASLLSLAVVALPAQADRYELGLRLRAFERRLAAEADEARRAAAFAELDRAVQAFFRFDTPGVAKAIDAAEIALGGGDSAAHRAARRLQLVPEARLVAAGGAAVQLRVSEVYGDEEGDAPPAGLVVRVESLAAGGDPLRIELDELPVEGALSIAGVPAGDHVLRWSVARGDEVLVRREQSLSLVDDLEPRLRVLEAEAEAAEKVEPATIESKTLPALVKLLRGMQRRRAEETVLPGAKLCAEAEALAAASEPFYDGSRAGDFHLRVPLGSGTAAIRLFVPEIADGARPLVVALHGAGGSENLFFDGYGDGLVVALARARGWFVVSPRLGFGGVDVLGLVDALAARFPIDVQQVVVVGHSMGAMQTVAQATRAPARFRAAAALGGGGRVPSRIDLSRLPWFVGAGERDFGRAGARALHQSLEVAKAKSTFREYSDVEHLAIVQVALPDVFAFFDAALAAGR